jgi:A/G-specific adenine glycosylase
MTKIQKFIDTIWTYYHEHKRHTLPWRHTITPYSILVSEVMLQQTQVSRVIEKYHEFLKAFPNFESLAKAELSDVLRVWQGMGYNRRAKYLREIAKIVVEKYNGQLPDNPVILDSFPGLGEATAASIVVYAFNKPIPFIETNIRRIYIHFFFKDAEGVDDKDIMPLVRQTLDINNPREWYYALMDYGTMLAKIVENPNRRSKHYSKQSKFEGSDRKIRGHILRELLKENSLTFDQLVASAGEDKDRIFRIIGALEAEEFVVKDEERYKLK